MENKEIAGTLKLVGQLMELHDENKFKSKSYLNAAFQIGKFPYPLSQLNEEELSSVPGIGKNLAPKVVELISTGQLTYLNKWLEVTPIGVLEMMRIKGLGPSKVRTIWKDLGLTSVGELLYACNENRLVELKGFGSKTQDQVKQAIEFLLNHKGQHLYASLEPLMIDVKEWVLNRFSKALISETGAVLRKEILLDKLEFVISEDVLELPDTSSTGIEVIYHKAAKNHFEETVLRLSITENDSAMEWKHVVPEMRNQPWARTWYSTYSENELITTEDLKGCLHNHSTYSDGMDTLSDMAQYLHQSGYAYLGISDHSKTAVYAGGLKEEDVFRQQEEIDGLNNTLSPFRILKGIESDILMDGSLDYADEVLSTFDFVVASIHSVLKMDEATATKRLIKAIEHPSTRILGHPSGRLLLSRPAYPIDYHKIIDACAANNVSIELNANPMRLDIDFRWIPYCMEKGVMISINPDAHRISGFDHMRFGVFAARKGGLIKSMCLNALSLNDLESYLRR
jgi:DNA polymerase (family 10)